MKLAATLYSNLFYKVRSKMVSGENAEIATKEIIEMCIQTILQDESIKIDWDKVKWNLADEPTPYILEQYTVNRFFAMRNAPNGAIEAYLENVREEVPTSFAQYQGRWYVISSPGQGPMIDWREK